MVRLNNASFPERERRHHCCTHTHTLLFVVTPFFQLWVGVLLSTQSFFIAGISNPELAKNNAFGAMGMFVFTFLTSLGGIYYDDKFKKETVPQTTTNGGYSSDLPGQYGATS